MPENQPSQTNRRPAEGLGNAPLSMYEISGHAKITASDIARYERDRTQDQAIRELAMRQNAGGVPLLSPHEIIERSLSTMDGETVTRLVREMLASPDPTVRVRAVKMLTRVPESEVAVFLEIGLNDTDHTVITAALSILTMLVQGPHLKNLYTPLADRLEQWITTGTPEQRLLAAKNMNFFIGDKLVRLEKLLTQKIQENLSDVSDNARQEDATKLIRFTSSKVAPTLLRIALALPTPGTFAIVGRLIPDHANNRKIQALFEQGIKTRLLSNDRGQQKVAVDLIKYARASEVLDLIRVALERVSPEVMRPVLLALLSLGSTKERETLSPIAAKRIEASIMGTNELERRAALRLIAHAPENSKNALLALAMKHCATELVEPPLYDKDTTLNSKQIARRPFAKTGSETTLVGGPLKNHLIVRHIPADAFLAWKKLFEGHILWRAAGFDYVPIEPIQSYRLNRKGLVDVYAGVLDINLQQWLDMNGTFRADLYEQEDKILKVLRSQTINHGHAHRHNFVLRFFRKENGEPDFTRVPRLYLIDFDQASSPETRAGN
ncbi:MAG: HEAT repeat domain-containing protein [Patescibacteria group bacterium]